MTIARDAPRPSSQHRPSASAMTSSLPARNSYSRSHSHSISIGTGSYNPSHRVTRRKSTTLNAATSAAAITAAINIDANGEIEGRNRRSVSSRNALGSLNRGASYPSPPSSLPQQPSGHSYAGKGSSSLSESLGDKGSKSKDSGANNRGRRASEASTLTKKKSGHGELKCETCGKGYKHSSCLTKHLWEHTPEWQLTSKLLISKHQQVQLLEAASVLMAMNIDPASDGAKMSDSENSSASPDASGFDSREDEPSSAETTPPPHGERSSFSHRKTYSNASSVVSRSYQSNFSESAGGHGRQWSTSSSGRPLTAQTSIAQSYPDEDRDQDMAAAMGLLNCASSYKSPRTGPLSLGADIPPVPELPPQYRGMSGASYQASSLSKVVPRRYQDDVEMEEDSYSDEDDRDTRRGDEADEGVFGNMEE